MVQLSESADLKAIGRALKSRDVAASLARLTTAALRAITNDRRRPKAARNLAYAELVRRRAGQ